MPAPRKIATERRYTRSFTCDYDTDQSLRRVAHPALYVSSVLAQRRAAVAAAWRALAALEIAQIRALVRQPELEPELTRDEAVRVLRRELAAGNTRLGEVLELPAAGPPVAKPKGEA